MDDRDPFTLPTRLPTPGRPLLGLTILVVEDSRFASEALRLLCLRSGARIRRADALGSAHRHLQVYRPSVALIDIGLRDGSGAELITDLVSVQPRTTIVLGMSGDPDGEEIARKAGADGFLAKPITSLGTFQETILRHLPSDRQPLGPRMVKDETVEPDPIAYQDDLAHIADMLGSPADEETIDYVTQFLGGVARSIDDTKMLDAVTALTLQRDAGRSYSREVAVLTSLVDARLERKIAM